MSTDLSDLRREYRKRILRIKDLADTPSEQFQRWFAEAQQAGVPEPNATTLATATPSGRPSARMVLLKGVDARGFAFFTNYESRKARELEANPQAALVFWWQVLERQVRVEGQVRRMGAEEADAYFRSRPRESQLSAHASPQSQPVESRKALKERFSEVRTCYEGQEVPRPEHWGGFLLEPEAVEFWQGRPGRLHDRLRYRRTEEGTWTIERLAP